MMSHKFKIIGIFILIIGLTGVLVGCDMNGDPTETGDEYDGILTQDIRLSSETRRLLENIEELTGVNVKIKIFHEESDYIQENEPLETENFVLDEENYKRVHEPENVSQGEEYYQALYFQQEEKDNIYEKYIHYGRSHKIEVPERVDKHRKVRPIYPRNIVHLDAEPDNYNTGVKTDYQFNFEVKKVDLKNVDMLHLSFPNGDIDLSGAVDDNPDIKVNNTEVKKIEKGYSTSMLSTLEIHLRDSTNFSQNNYEFNISDIINPTEFEAEDNVLGVYIGFLELDDDTYFRRNITVSQSYNLWLNTK